jgi:DNA-binding HxlR family transcriptional regulator
MTTPGLGNDSGNLLKITSLLELATPRLLLFVHDRGEVRYSDLSKLVPSRGTLSTSLKELEEEGLLTRRIVSSKPIKAYYSLTKRGAKVAGFLADIARALQET